MQKSRQYSGMGEAIQARKTDYRESEGKTLEPPPPPKEEILVAS